jgi:hypothetical protein
MAMWPVTTAVGSVRNTGAELSFLLSGTSARVRAPITEPETLEKPTIPWHDAMPSMHLLQDLFVSEGPS